MTDKPDEAAAQTQRKRSRWGDSTATNPEPDQPANGNHAETAESAESAETKRRRKSKVIFIPALPHQYSG